MDGDWLPTDMYLWYQHYGDKLLLFACFDFSLPPCLPLFLCVMCARVGGGGVCVCVRVYSIMHDACVTTVKCSCFRGYTGPGGLSEGGVYQNCTGGAARYIDVMVLGESHMYHYPTPQVRNIGLQTFLCTHV